jgi:hypothetical protein
MDPLPLSISTRPPRTHPCVRGLCSPCAGRRSPQRSRSLASQQEPKTKQRSRWLMLCICARTHGRRRPVGRPALRYIPWLHFLCRLATAHTPPPHRCAAWARDATSPAAAGNPPPQRQGPGSLENTDRIPVDKDAHLST